jgi:hypothetical protein
METSFSKKVQVFSLVCSLVLFTIPGSVMAAGSQSGPSVVYVQHKADSFKLDLGGLLGNIDDLLTARTGTVTITLSRGLQDGDSSSEADKTIFSPGDNPNVEDFLILGNSATPASRDAIRSLGENSDWRHVVQFTVTAAADYLEYKWEIGSDTQSLRYPWALFGLEEIDPEAALPDVVVSLNGNSASVPFELLTAISEEILESGIMLPTLDTTSVEELAYHLNDPVRFAGDFVGFNLILASFLKSSGGPGISPCGISCISCGISLIGYGVSLAALFASCATLTPICILGIIGHEVAGTSLVLSCSSCFRCLRRDPRSSIQSGTRTATGWDLFASPSP